MKGVPVEASLRAARDKGRKLLVPYVTGGLRDDWVAILSSMADAGADAIEVGLPFSDPMMDGPTIQEASLQALQRGTTPTSVLDELRSLEAPVPLVVMTYCNLVLRAGTKRFASATGRRRREGRDRARPPPRGVGAVGGGRRRRGGRDGPVGRPGYARRPPGGICEHSHGFVYGVNLMGVTGERDSLSASSSVPRQAHQGGHRQTGHHGFWHHQPDPGCSGSGALRWRRSRIGLDACCD